MSDYLAIYEAVKAADEPITTREIMERIACEDYAKVRKTINKLCKNHKIEVRQRLSNQLYYGVYTPPRPAPAPKPEGERVTFRISQELLEKVDAVAAANDMTRSDVLRLSVQLCINMIAGGKARWPGTFSWTR